MEVIKFIISVLKWILTTIAFILILGLLIGYRLYVLESDSMSPLYPKGSIVVLDSRSTMEEIEIGDVIGVMVGNSRVFHRVIAIIPSTESGLPFCSFPLIPGQHSPPSNFMKQDSVMIEYVYRLASDKDPTNWTDVKITHGNLLGKLVCSVPGIGSTTTLFIRNPWFSWFAAFFIILLVMIPWKRIIEQIRLRK